MELSYRHSFMHFFSKNILKLITNVKNQMVSQFFRTLTANGN